METPDPPPVRTDDMTARTRLRLWLLDHLPDGMLARPGEWFLAFLCVLSGIPTMLGQTESESLEELLPAALYQGWGACLVVGGAALMVGLSSIHMTYSGSRYVILRIPAYRLGLRLLGISSVVYAGALAIEIGLVGALVPLLAFAAMCGIRLLTIGGR